MPINENVHSTLITCAVEWAIITNVNLPAFFEPIISSYAIVWYILKQYRMGIMATVSIYNGQLWERTIENKDIFFVD